MGTRLKEDEKNERIIRSLLKLPANRRCINCNSLGPQYVCTTFWTFVCTTCSGIHREFTHRVKSVSMAKFTSQEVSSLQTGGNERAKEIYFKELDLHRQGPDSSNVDRLRDFIKRVYVNRQYTGERSSDRPPRGDAEEPNDNRRPDSSRSGSRSPPYEDTYQRRYNDRPSPGYEGRSPGHVQDNRRHSDYGRSPARPGIVSDWRREDRFANGRSPARSEGESVSGGRSPDSQKDFSISSPPTVRPVREILGDNATPLRVIEPPRVSGGGGKVGQGGSTQLTQRTASSSSLASSNGNASESKKIDSLIDFDADPEPPAPAPATLTQPQPAPIQSVESSTPSTGGDWACFDFAPEPKPSQTPASINPMDSILTQLSVPASTPSPLSEFPAPGGSVTSAPPVNANASGNLLDSLTTQAPIPTVSAPTHTQNGAYGSAPSNTTVLPNNNAAFSPSPASGSLGAFAPGLTPNNGAAQSSTTQNPQQFLFSGFGQGASSTLNVQGAVAGATSTQTPEGATQPLETKPTGRKELPADLFAAMYAPQPVAAHGWQTGVVPGMGYHMQFNAAATAPTYPFAKPFNPFDVGTEAPPARPTNLQFPSMAPMQATLPNMTAPPGLVGTSNLNTVRPLWGPPQPAGYPSLAPQQTPLSGTTAMPPGTYLSQQSPNSSFLPPGNNGFGGIGNDTAGFNSMNVTPPSNLNAGNPFG